jgi:NAD-dependent SIR2 family protein deacetylase
MSYSKRDFLHWDEDINLDDLLGEYTHSECEDVSDDMVFEPMPQKPQSRIIYKCSECESGFASVTGIRGHLQKKHGRSRIRGIYKDLPLHALTFWLQ